MCFFLCYMQTDSVSCSFFYLQLSELLAIRHCVFLMGPSGSGRTEAYRVLAKAITNGCDDPVNDYLRQTNKMKVVIRDINPKSISTQVCLFFQSAFAHK